MGNLAEVKPCCDECKGLVLMMYFFVNNLDEEKPEYEIITECEDCGTRKNLRIPFHPLFGGKNGES